MSAVEQVILFRVFSLKRGIHNNFIIYRLELSVFLKVGDKAVYIGSMNNFFPKKPGFMTLIKMNDLVLYSEKT